MNVDLILHKYFSCCQRIKIYCIESMDRYMWQCYKILAICTISECSKILRLCCSLSEWFLTACSTITLATSEVEIDHQLQMSSHAERALPKASKGLLSSLWHRRRPGLYMYHKRDFTLSTKILILHSVPKYIQTCKLSKIRNLHSPRVALLDLLFWAQRTSTGCRNTLRLLQKVRSQYV